MATLKRVRFFCRYGNPVESPVWCWGYVEGVCGVCVVDIWFTASPGLSQTDDSGWVGLHTCGACRDGKSTQILYLSKSKTTCVKNDFSKSESTDPNIHSSK